MTIDLLSRLIRDETGSTAIDYAVIASLISVGALLGYVTFAESANNVWIYASDTILAALN